MPGRQMHFIQRLYLAGFTDESNELWAHHHLGQRWSRHLAPEIVGKEIDYYRDDLGPDSPSEFDDRITAIESSAVDVLLAMRETGALPSRWTRDWRSLIEWISISVLRSPATRRYALAVGQGISDSALEDPSYTDEDWVFLNNNNDSTAQEAAVTELLVTTRDRATHRLTPLTQAVVHALSISRLLQSLPPVLDQRRWSIARTTGADFITGDSPVVLERIRHGSEPAFDSELFAVVMTLSPRVALIGRFIGRDGDIAAMNDRRVELINGLILASSERLVFSREKEFIWRDRSGVRQSTAAALEVGSRDRPEVGVLRRLVSERESSAWVDQG